MFLQFSNDDGKKLNAIRFSSNSVNDPQASPGYGAGPVVLSSSINGSSIYYTIDGVDPLISPSSMLYTIPIDIHQDNTALKFFASKYGMGDSDIITGFFGVAPAAPTGLSVL